MPQSPENSYPNWGRERKLTPRQKMLQQWVRAGQLKQNDPMQLKKKRWMKDQGVRGGQQNTPAGRGTVHPRNSPKKRWV